MKTYLYRVLNLKSTITFLASVSQRKSSSGARMEGRLFHNSQTSLCSIISYCDTVALIMLQNKQTLLCYRISRPYYVTEYAAPTMVHYKQPYYVT